MRNLTKILIIFNLTIANLLLFSNAMYANDTHKAYCIRVYCGKDSSKKIRNEQGHGKFFPAIYYADNKNYLVTKDSLDIIKDKCNENTGFYGKNAATLETLAQFKRIMLVELLDNEDKELSKKIENIAENCQETERK